MPVIKGKSDSEVKIMLCHCVHHKIGRHKKLTCEERLLYDYLIKNGLSAKTIYKYFVVLNYPDTVKELLHNKKIGMDGAASRAFSLRKMKSDSTSKELMAEIKAVIGGLEWKGLNKVQLQI